MEIKDKLIKYYWGVPIKTIVDNTICDYGKRHTKWTLKFKVHKDFQKLFFPKKISQVRKGRVFVDKEVPCDLLDLTLIELVDIIIQIKMYAALMLGILISEPEKKKYASYK